MGGAIDIVSSTLGIAQELDAMSTKESAATTQLRAEREAQEAEQQKQEADDRRRKRQQVTEAREIQRRRLAKPAGQTTLMNGGQGLTKDPNVFVPTLKETFGE